MNSVHTAQPPSRPWRNARDDERQTGYLSATIHLVDGMVDSGIHRIAPADSDPMNLLPGWRTTYRDGEPQRCAPSDAIVVSSVAPDIQWLTVALSHSDEPARLQADARCPGFRRGGPLGPSTLLSAAPSCARCRRPGWSPGAWS